MPLLTLATLAELGGCGGDEFLDRQDTGGRGGTSGSGGSSGTSADARTDGPAKDASTSDVSSDHAAGTGGGPAEDARPDTEPSLCFTRGFWTEPTQPRSPAFKLFYKSPQALVCIDFRVTCSNGEASLTAFDPAQGACPSSSCWGTAVSNCGVGPATVEFVENKDVGSTGDYCHDTFSGSAGELVASCTFDVNP